VTDLLPSYGVHHWVGLRSRSSTHESKPVCGLSYYPKHKQIHNLVYMGLDNKKKRRILAEAKLDYPKN
jgi:hypothetical protein